MPSPPPLASLSISPLRSLWLAVALSMGAAISLGITRFAYALLLPPMREDLGWSYTLAGGMNTINALGYLLGALATLFGLPVLIPVPNQLSAMRGVLSVLGIGAAPAVANVRSASATVVAVVASATALLVAVVQLVDVVRSHAGVDASPRYGVVALVASSLLLVLACVVIAGAGRPAKVSAPRAVGAVG